MSQLSSFDSILERFEALNSLPILHTNEPRDAPSENVTAMPTTNDMPPPLVFQNIEDWDRDADEIEAHLLAEAQLLEEAAKASPKKKPVIEPLVKKPKMATDPEDLVAEKKAVEEMGLSNWVGKLQMFRDARDATAGGRVLDWKGEVLMNPLTRFTCTIVIRESSNVFGIENIGSTDKIVSFSDKKNAKRFAAMKAVKWLIENGFLTSDGSLPPKPILPPQAKKVTKSQTSTVADAEEVFAITKAEQEIGSENWIGKLQMYRDTRPIPGNGIDWDQEVLLNPTPRFVVTVLIHESATPFGREIIGLGPKVVSFGNKKSAKQFAAKRAIDWLIENGYIHQNSSQPTKVATPPSTSPQTQQSSMIAPPVPSPRSPSATIPFVQQVPDLCQRLGVNIPSYKIEQASPGSAMCDGYADFGGDPSIDGKVGEVKNVYGRKAAKEEVARIVYSFLRDIERQRREQFDLSYYDDDEEEDDDDKKRKRSINSSPGEVSKSVKVFA